MGTPYDVVFFAPDSFPGKINISFSQKDVGGFGFKDGSCIY